MIWVVIGGGPAGYAASHSVPGNWARRWPAFELERAGRDLPELGLYPLQGAAESGEIVASMKEARRILAST